MLLAALLVCAAPIDTAAPSPQPSGMDLLYNDRVPFGPNGEPLITLGLASGRSRVVLRSDSSMQADFYEAGTLKRTRVRAGDTVELSMLRAQPARRRHYVDLEGVGWTQPDRLDWALAGWKARGYPKVEALEEGSVLGIGGRVIDTREYRIVLPVAGAVQAQRVVNEVYELFGVRAFASARLEERPWGELSVRVRGAPLGVATSFIRLSTLDGAIQVDAVEHAKGYTWHGFEDRRYQGEVYVVVDPDGKMAVVNVLGAERVLAGVVPAEMYASSPTEALRAQAVAARNQLLAKLGKRHHDDPFRLCSEQHCQVYAGTLKEDPRATQAVHDTEGEVLFLEGHLVDTVYSSSCGGHTEDNDIVWGNDPDPALRGRPDFEVDDATLRPFADGIDEADMRSWVTTRPNTYCGRASKARAEKFRWQRTFTGEELGNLVNAHFSGIGKLRNLEVDERGVSGRAVSIRLVGDHDDATVLHELAIRTLFGLNSGAFLIDVERDRKGTVSSVVFTGAGWGHGVGMCQLGAVGRAEAGQAYRDILAHYYNGATVQRLYGTPPQVELSRQP